MNLRCAFCQTPYAISRTEILAALQHLESEKLSHYDAHCPRCQRATRVQRQKLELAYPNWRDELKELASQAEAVADAQQGAPASAPKPEPASALKAESKPKPAPAKTHKRSHSHKEK